jgi:hypothetical protein
MKNNFRDSDLNFIDSKEDVIKFSNAIVDPSTGIIFDLNKNEIIWEAANEYLLWFSGYEQLWMSSDPLFKNRISRISLIHDRMLKLDSLIRNKIAQNKVRKITGTVLHLLHPFGFYVYGHFFDTMQKMYAVDKFNLTFDSAILSNPSKIIDIETHLKSLGLENKAHFLNNSNELIHLDWGIYLRPISQPPIYTRDSFEFLSKKYSSTLKEKSEKTYKLFFNRQKGVVPRFVLNGEYLENFLSTNGIEIINGNEPLMRLIDMIGNATHIAGPHGSLFINGIFSNAQTKFLEFCPSNRINKAFEYQFKDCRNYKFMEVNADSESNIEISPEVIMEFYNNESNNL